MSTRPADPSDVLVVGTGLGGASLALRLAARGIRVTLIERGAWARRDEGDWDPKKILVDKVYQSASPTRVSQYGRAPRDEHHNEVVGGLSVFYGGAALRLREEDFRAWPLDYAAFEPYYTQAEALLEVHGEADDPTGPPRAAPYPYPARALTAPAQRVKRAAASLGLEPCRIPLAINHQNAARPRCEDCFTCDGFPCKLGAKNEAATSALAAADPALLDVRDQLAALELERRDRTIVGVRCLDLRTRETLSLPARLVVVSGGALQSPALLLRSGLAELDPSGSLGRNLMRHCNAIVGCLFPFRVNRDEINHKQILVSSLYHRQRAEKGTAVGVIQDMCMPPPAAVRQNAPWGLGFLAGLFSRFIQALICIAEDLPQPRNRVSLGADRDALGIPVTEVFHAYHPDDLARRDLLVRTAKRILRRSGGLLCVTSKIASFSHGLGTVRFGADPGASALDTDCRFWNLDNLYVVDGCFMPSSGGVNPSLTIVANALRVADRLAAERLGK